MTTKQTLTALGVALGLILVAHGAVNLYQNTLGGGGVGVGTTACRITTNASTTVGHQTSLQVLAPKANRAWATVEHVGDTTNKVFLGLDNTSGTTTAKVNDGHMLATTTPVFVSGLATDNPYVGGITAITNTSSTTVLVTECSY